MGVKFDLSVVTNYGHVQTVEESFKVFGNWAKIHDFSFVNDYEEDELVIGKSTQAGWSNRQLLPNPVQSDLLLECDFENSAVIDDGFAAIFAWNSSTNSGYLVGVEGANFVCGNYNGTSITYIKKYPLPFSVSGGGRWQFIMRQQFYSSDEGDLWLSFSVYLNDSLIGTVTIYTGTPIQYTPYAGFAYFGTENDVILENIRIPQLTAFVEWNSLDTGEKPLGGLERTIDGRYLKMSVRGNGSLRGWRSRPTPLIRTYDYKDEIHVSNIVKDKREQYSHIRLLGSFVQAEYINGPLLRKGHRFIEINNPYLMTEADCFNEAKNQARVMMENAYIESISSYFSALVEVEDRIATPDGERIINSRSLDFRPGMIAQSLQARQYGFSDTLRAYYVDPLLGDDDNPGTKALPFATFGALPELASGDTIYIPRDRTFSDSFIPTVAVNLESQGVGDDPLFKCQEDIDLSAAVLVGGTTNVYSANVTSPNNASTKSWHSVWEDSVRLQRVASDAACDALPGSYYIADDNDSNTFSLHVHASTSVNPASTGFTYEMSIHMGLDFSGAPGSSIKGVVVHGSLNMFGGIELGKNSSAESFVIEEGSVHGITVKEGCTVQNFTLDGFHVWGDSSPIYCYDITAASKNIDITGGNILEGDIKLPGLVAIKTKSNGSNMLGVVTVKDMSIIGCERLSQAEDVVKLRFEQVVFDGTVDGDLIGRGSDITEFLTEHYQVEMLNCVTFGWTTEDDCKAVYEDCDLHFTGDMDGGGIYMEHNITLTVQNSRYLQDTSGINQIALVGENSPVVDIIHIENIFTGGSHLWKFNSTASGSLISNGNCLDSDKEFEWDNIHYMSLADAQLDGFEDETTIGGC